MAPSFLQRLFGQKKRASDAWWPSTVGNLAQPETPASDIADQRDTKPSESGSAAENTGAITKTNSLFAFVDPKDPFTPGEIAGEQLPGPILSIMSAKQFRHLFLFHTPHTREHAVATEKEVSSRYPECQIVVNELPVSDPKDYSSIMGRLARTVRRLMDLESSEIADCYVCVSSGTAEMRAAWFLLAALGILPAKLLQVGSPARPLFGEANVKEVQMDSSDWLTIRDVAMPDEYFRAEARESVTKPEAKYVALGTRGISSRLENALTTLTRAMGRLRRGIKKPEDIRPHEKRKTGEEIFEEAFLEQMRMKYGDLGTERRLPYVRGFLRSGYVLALYKHRDKELSTDNLRDLGRKWFGSYERPELMYRSRLAEAERLGAFPKVPKEVLLKKYASSVDTWSIEDTQAPGASREPRHTPKQSQTVLRAKEPLRNEAAGKARVEAREQAPDGAAEVALTEGEEEIDLGESLDAGSLTFDTREALAIPGLDDALRELGIFIGSAALRHAAEQAGIAAGSHLPVLLLGETGTGKDRFANLIHRLSPRFHRELVAINCAAIPVSLAESYLFGHVKGAFTDAITDGNGIFADADQSTLFLDEVAELTLEVQAKLLRVINDGVVQRLGSRVSRKVDVRIIAASNRDLRKEVSAGRFREDLYFRLVVVQIKLPPLRERRSEIPELALMLLRRINQLREKPRQLTTRALTHLERQPWPGNVRDLLNVLEASVLYSRADVIDAQDLKFNCDPPGKDPFVALPELSDGFKLEKYLAQIRNQLFLQALEACNGNQTAAAKMLGVSKQTVSKFVLAQNDNEN